MAERNLISKIYILLDQFQSNASSYGRRQFFSIAAELYKVELQLAEISESDGSYDVKELAAIYKRVMKMLTQPPKKE